MIKNLLKFTLWGLIFFTPVMRSAIAQSLGDYTSAHQSEKSLTIHTTSGSVRLIPYADDIVRVDFLPTDTTESDSSFVIIQDSTTYVGFQVQSTDATMMLTMNTIHVIIQKYPVRLSFQKSNGEILLQESESGGMGSSGHQRIARFQLTPNGRFYGSGERGGGLNLRNRIIELYNTQNYGYSRAPAQMNINVPYIGSNQGYALYFDNTYPAEFDIGASDPNQLVYQTEGGELTYYVIASSNIPGQLERYTWLTGRQPLPPKWALGYLQSKFGYRTEQEAREMVATMREKNFPGDAIILDFYWSSHMGDLSWDLSNWSDPDGMISEFADDGIHTIILADPYFVENSDYYGELTNQYPEFVGRDLAGAPYTLSNWWSCGCNAVLFDITNPDAQNWLWEKYSNLLDMGLAGLWTDLGEPERHPPNMHHSLGSAAKVHNIYNLLWAQTIFQNYSNYTPDSRIFNLTRSGFAGIQRYGVFTWSGDVSKSYDGLASQVPFMLNMGLSGLAYHSSDIGGFCYGNTTPELYIRWLELGVFSPFVRPHGTDFQATEPWTFGTIAESYARNLLTLRNQLIPYIYTTARENYLTGIPIVRPLFFDNQDDPSLMNNIESYMFGESFLVSPVLQEGVREKTLFLPQGKWIELWTDDIYTGGQSVTVDAPLPQIPLFVKSGSIIPMQPPMDYVDTEPADTMKIHIYPDPQISGEFSLYEDDGITTEYQGGAFATTTMSYDLQTIENYPELVINIDATTGSFSGMPQSRTYRSITHLLAQPPDTVIWTGGVLLQTEDLPELTSSNAGYYYDTATNSLYIQTRDSLSHNQQFRVRSAEISTSLELNSTLAQQFSLHQNYPNPFNPMTNIEFELNVKGFTSLKVYNLRGQVVATLVDEVLEPGHYSFNFKATEDLSSGIYIYRLKSSDVISTRKMLFVK